MTYRERRDAQRRNHPDRRRNHAHRERSESARAVALTGLAFILVIALVVVVAPLLWGTPAGSPTP